MGLLMGSRNAMIAIGLMGMGVMINVKYSLDGHVLMIMGFMLDALLYVGMELGLEINYFLGVVTTLILTLEMDASNAKFNHCMFVPRCKTACYKGEFCKIIRGNAVCTPYCGDGIVARGEHVNGACDDGN